METTSVHWLNCKHKKLFFFNICIMFHGFIESFTAFQISMHFHNFINQCLAAMLFFMHYTSTVLCPSAQILKKKYYLSYTHTYILFYSSITYWLYFYAATLPKNIICNIYKYQPSVNKVPEI